MSDEFAKLYEAAKALVAYIDREDVFDRAPTWDAGRGHPSIETFYNLIANARKALRF